MALADDVRRYLRQEPVAARPDSPWYRWRKFVARRRIGLAAAAVVLGARRPNGVAVRQAGVSAGERNRALEQLRRAEAVNDLSAFLLSQARPGQTLISNAELLMLADRYFENQQFDAWRRVLGRAHADARRTNDAVLHAQATCAWAAHLVEQENVRRARGRTRDRPWGAGQSAALGAPRHSRGHTWEGPVKS